MVKIIQIVSNNAAILYTSVLFSSYFAFSGHVFLQLHVRFYSRQNFSITLSQWLKILFHFSIYCCSKSIFHPVVVFFQPARRSKATRYVLALIKHDKSITRDSTNTYLTRLSYPDGIKRDRWTEVDSVSHHYLLASISGTIRHFQFNSIAEPHNGSKTSDTS